MRFFTDEAFLPVGEGSEDDSQVVAGEIFPGSSPGEALVRHAQHLERFSGFRIDSAAAEDFPDADRIRMGRDLERNRAEGSPGDRDFGLTDC